MEVEKCIPVGQVGGSYPTVRVEGRNPRYAEAMLSNIGGVTSELSSISLYYYNQLITAGVPEVTETFHQIGLEELRHLETFGALALQLGADPRFWSAPQGRRAWWSPEYLHYNRRLGPLLHNALHEERSTLRKYENQARWIRDTYILELLHRIMAEERQHIELISDLCLRHVPCSRL